jgi:hypothetical protein
MEDNVSMVANAGERPKRNDKIKKLRSKLGKKTEVIGELDVIEMKLIAQKKCLSKIKKVASKLSKSLDEMQVKMPEKAEGEQDLELKKLKKEVASCTQITKALKSYISKDKALNNLKLNETRTTKDNVTIFINDLVANYNSLLKESMIQVVPNEIQPNSNNQLSSAPNGKISHALFDLYEQTKNKSLQELIKESKKKNTANAENNKKRKRKKTG